jgi:hypothetical protein
MRKLLFLARVAFICNLLFILCLFLRHTHLTIPQGFTEFVIIAGWIMSVVLNAIFNTLVIITTVKKQALQLPSWMTAFNIILFFFQIFYFLIYS